jgi:hypothetical protein
MTVVAVGGMVFKNCDLCNGTGVDAKMRQSVTGKGKNDKEFYFVKRFLALCNKRMWPLASKLLLLSSKLLLLISKSILLSSKSLLRWFWHNSHSSNFEINTANLSRTRPLSHPIIIGPAYLPPTSRHHMKKFPCALISSPKTGSTRFWRTTSSNNSLTVHTQIFLL